MDISKEIFRAYDIRGVVDKDLTDDVVFNIGKAIGSKTKNKIIVGRDGRLSSERFADKLIAGILSSGCDAVDIGMVPTPVLYFATKFLNISSAVMITGSHNPSNYNGFKMMMAGQTLYGTAVSGDAGYTRVGVLPVRGDRPGHCDLPQGAGAR